VVHTLMTSWHPTRSKILEALSDGKPKSSAEIARSTGLESDAVWAALRRYWQKNLVLRSTRQLREQHYAFKGRKGVIRNLRAYHLYMLKPENIDSSISGNIEFASYRSWNHSNSKVKSKASSIFDFLKTNSHRAYFATEIVKILSKNGTKPSDVMSNVRRWERIRLFFQPLPGGDHELFDNSFRI
jgi:hypothetical protein